MTEPSECNHKTLISRCEGCGEYVEAELYKARKIVQIVSFPKSHETKQQDMIVALCNDGTLWSLSLDDGSDWNSLNRPIPQR